MADQGLGPARPRTPLRAWFGAALALAALAALGLAGWTAYRSYTERYVVSVEPDSGLAVAKVVAATLDRASDLKVSTLTGTVQSTARDSRAFGWLNSARVIKAPFAVEYFVDVSGLSPRDFHWDAKTRTLLLDAPAVRAGEPNIDEAHVYLDRTTGVFVTRAAMAALAKQASGNAVAVARREALKPDHLDAARANARRALERLFAAPLAAAGLDAKVEVRFAGERPTAGDGRRWDVSRSLQDVLGNAR